MLPWKPCLALALAAFVLAVGVSRRSGFEPPRAAPITVVDGPSQVVVLAGSLEARVRWLEGRVLILQDRLDSGDEAR